MSGTTPASPPCGGALARKLRRFAHPSQADLEALELLARPRRHAAPEQTLLREGDRGRCALLIHEGWALRYRSLADGRRQIMEFLLPGDLCDPSSFASERCDSSVAAITPLEYSLVRPEALHEAIDRAPGLGVCLWWLESQHAAMMRSHLLAVGRMTARERIAYLVWELTRRLELVAESPPSVFRLPVSQELIADALGLSVVHVSRTLAGLQREGILHRHGQAWQLLAPQKLRALAQAPGDWPQAMPEGLQSTSYPNASSPSER